MLYRRSFDLHPISKDEAAEAGGLYSATFDELIQYGAADRCLGTRAEISVVRAGKALTIWLMRRKVASITSDDMLFFEDPKDRPDNGAICQYEKSSDESCVRRSDMDDPLTRHACQSLSDSTEDEAAFWQGIFCSMEGRLLEHQMGISDQPVGIEEVTLLCDLVRSGTILRPSADQ